MSKLAGGVAVLYVGAATEVEMKEKKDRVDDALHATRAAVEEGIVPGGGVAYIRAIAGLEKLKGALNADEATGIAIVKRAIEEPLRQIVANCGIEGSIVVQNIKEGEADYGFNARTEVYENMFKAGVIDPTNPDRRGCGRCPRCARPCGRKTGRSGHSRQATSPVQSFDALGLHFGRFLPIGLQALKVAASAKHRAFAGNDDAAYFGIVLGRVKRLNAGGIHFRT